MERLSISSFYPEKVATLISGIMESHLKVLKIAQNLKTGTHIGVIVAVVITLIIIVGVGVWVYRAGMTIPPGIRQTSMDIFARVFGQSVSE